MAPSTPLQHLSAQEAWQRPLLTQRKGLPEGGRVGALKGRWIDHRLVEDPRTATEVINKCRGAQAPLARGDSRPEPPSGVRSDAGIELVIDGQRWCEDPATGRWRPCVELGEVDP